MVGGMVEWGGLQATKTATTKTATTKTAQMPTDLFYTLKSCLKAQSLLHCHADVDAICDNFEARLICQDTFSSMLVNTIGKCNLEVAVQMCHDLAAFRGCKEAGGSV